MQDCSEAKKPCKGILKTSSSFDRPSASNNYRKSAKFDEMNVLQTYHPADKDYGHMKIDEPKTPFNYTDESHDQLDADLLAEKLRIAANTQAPNFGPDDLSDDEFPETDVEKVRRIEFERRRKAHYNEFEAVRLARQLIEEELRDTEEEEEDLTGGDESAAKSKVSSDFYVSESNEGGEESLGAGAVSANALAEEQRSASSDMTGDAAASPVERSMDVDLPLEPSHPCSGRRTH